MLERVVGLTFAIYIREEKTKDNDVEQLLARVAKKEERAGEQQAAENVHDREPPEPHTIRPKEKAQVLDVRIVHAVLPFYRHFVILYGQFFVSFCFQTFFPPRRFVGIQRIPILI